MTAKPGERPGGGARIAWDNPSEEKQAEL